MATYTVVEGDCISSIADEAGFFWETIWNDPGNAELKKLRKNPNSLLPGDVLVVPDKRKREEQCVTTKTHRFRLKGVPVQLRYRMLDVEGKPRARIPYSLIVDGAEKKGSTDGNGVLTETIKPKSKKARLVLKPAGEPEEVYLFDLGQLHPVEDMRGLQGRLKNLGFLDGEPSGEFDEDTADALRKFQKANELPETGEADAATQAKVAERHGG
ncbi:MAG TPA: peptidoglycan-binding protein [Bryobacteraceae bacterium]|nr:peptidoglycan-binding protein [Bryobacteraceae bacterium]